MKGFSIFRQQGNKYCGNDNRGNNDTFARAAQSPNNLNLVSLPSTTSPKLQKMFANMKNLGEAEIQELQKLGVSINTSSIKTSDSSKSTKSWPNRQVANLAINMNDNPKQSHVKSDCQIQAEAQNNSQKKGQVNVSVSKITDGTANKVELTFDSSNRTRLPPSTYKR